MVTILVENSYSKITGLSAKQEKALRNELSYIVGGQSAYFTGFGVKRRSLLSKKCEFPSGLLFRVEQFFYNNKINFDFKDIRLKPK
jgi:hypothetical protein